MPFVLRADCFYVPTADGKVALLDMGDDSLVGIVDLMTGEKDPRNLMVAFSILRVVMMEWDISNHAEVKITLFLLLTSC